MVLYRITLVSLVEETQASDLGILTYFYSNNATFDGSTWRSAQLLKLLLKRGYLPETANHIFISDSPNQEEVLGEASPLPDMGSASYNNGMKGGYWRVTLLMVLYEITPIPIAEELWAADPGILTPFNANDAAFDKSARRSSHILTLILEMVYFSKPANLLFIADSSNQEEAAKRQLEVEGLNLNFVCGSWYLGAYLGPRETLEAWVQPQLES